MRIYRELVFQRAYSSRLVQVKVVRDPFESAGVSWLIYHSPYRRRLQAFDTGDRFLYFTTSVIYRPFRGFPAVIISNRVPQGQRLEADLVAPALALFYRHRPTIRYALFIARPVGTRAKLVHSMKQGSLLFALNKYRAI